MPLHVTVADFRRDALLCVVGTGSVHELSQNGVFASKHAHSTASVTAADKMHSEACRLTNRTVRMCRRPDNTADFYLCNHRGRHEPRIPSRHHDSTLGSPSPPHLLMHTTFPGRPAAQVHHYRRPAPTLGRFGGSSERFGCLACVSAGEQRGYGASVDSCAQAWRAKTRSLRGRTLRFGGATGATRYAW